MAKSVTVRLDDEGVQEVLTSNGVAELLVDLGGQVAGGARAGGVPAHMPVTVETYTTDRAAVSVAIAHHRGRDLEAKYGYLTRAAAAVGLEVRSR